MNLSVSKAYKFIKLIFLLNLQFANETCQWKTKLFHRPILYKRSKNF